MKTIVCKNEQEWLEMRKQFITASTVASILGMNKHESAYTAWAKMVGAIDPEPPNIQMKVGHALEPVVAEAYEEMTGRTLYDLGDFTLVKHPRYDIIACTPDRIHDDDDTPCELKTTQWLGQEGQSVGWETQVQVQMGCLEADSGVVAVLEKTRNISIEMVQFKPKFLELAMPEIDKFWECVQKEIPPEIDSSESTQNTIKQIYLMADDAKEVQIDDERILDAVEILQELKQQIKEIEAEKREQEVLIQAAMQDAKKASIGGMYQISYPTIRRSGVLRVDPKYMPQLKDHGVNFKHTPENFHRRMTIKETR